MQRKRWIEWSLVLGLSALSFLRMYCFNSSRLTTVDGGDEIYYDHMAVNLLEGHGFSQSFSPPYKPTAFRTPGYPGFLALVYRLFGERNYQAVRVVQILLVLAAGLALYGAVVLLLEDRPAALASLALFSAYSFAYGNEGIYSRLLTESLPIFLVAGGFLAAALCCKRPQPAYYLLAGGLFGLAALTRPSNLYFPVVLAGVFALLRLKARDIAVFCAAWALAVAPWYARNHRLFSRWMFAYPITGWTLVIGLGSNPDFVYNSACDPVRDRGGMEATPEELAYIGPRLAAVSDAIARDAGAEIEKPDAELREVGLRIVRHDPAGALKRFFYRVLGLWSLADLANGLNGIAPVTSVQAVLRILAKLALGLLAFFGVFAMRERGARLLVSAYPAYNTLIYGLVGLSQVRYGFPARAFLFVALAAALVQLTRSLWSRSRRCGCARPGAGR